MKLKARFWILSFALCACTVDSAQNHYKLAEKLWSDQNYGASVSEYERVVAKDPKGKLGLKALHRAAMIQFLSLGEYEEAISKLGKFIERTPDAEKAWDARILIGEILFEKLERYEDAIEHFSRLIQLRPEDQRVPEFLFKMGRSHYFLVHFSEAVETFRSVVNRFPKSDWAEKSALEVGNCFLSQNSSKASRVAYEEFSKFLNRYPNSPLIPEAKFGMASALEELDQLEDAQRLYESIQSSYPAKDVLKVKIKRIRERIAKRTMRR